MSLAQPGNLQKRLARARQKPHQIAFFRARLRNQLGPRAAVSPTRGGSCRRKVYLGHSFDFLLPFFGGNFECDLFKFHQQTYDGIVELHFAIIAIFIRYQRRNQGGGPSSIK